MTELDKLNKKLRLAHIKLFKLRQQRTALGKEKNKLGGGADPISYRRRDEIQREQELLRGEILTVENEISDFRAKITVEQHKIAAAA